jgi:hypothetical protein
MSEQSNPEYWKGVDAVAQLIDRWIAMENELPKDPVQVLTNLRQCIKGEGPYHGGKPERKED